jgi:hypothetical protein
MTIQQSYDWRCAEQECGAFEKDGGNNERANGGLADYGRICSPVCSIRVICGMEPLEIFQEIEDILQNIVVSQCSLLIHSFLFYKKPLKHNHIGKQGPNRP